MNVPKSHNVPRVTLHLNVKDDELTTGQGIIFSAYFKR